MTETRDAASFNHGYVLACCNVAHLHGHPEIAHDILRELGVTKAQVEAMDLCEYDLEALKEIEKARGKDSVYADPSALSTKGEA